MAGAHSGERRHRQSRGEESLQEFKPVSEWWDEIGAGKESFGVFFCQEGDQLGATAGGEGGDTLYTIRNSIPTHLTGFLPVLFALPPRSYACSPRPR